MCMVSPKLFEAAEHHQQSNLIIPWNSSISTSSFWAGFNCYIQPLWRHPSHITCLLGTLSSVRLVPCQSIRLTCITVRSTLSSFSCCSHHVDWTSLFELSSESLPYIAWWSPDCWWNLKLLTSLLCLVQLDTVGLYSWPVRPCLPVL